MSERQTEEKLSEKRKSVSTLKGLTFTPSGSAIAPVYKRVFNKESGKSLVTKVDETNLDEFIQASRSQTDLALLQKRFIELGELPRVNPNLGYDVDTTLFPNDIHGVYDMVNNVDSNFKSLPKEVQDVFGDSQAYLTAVLNGSYQATLINAFSKKQQTETQKEGVTNE